MEYVKNTVAIAFFVLVIFSSCNDSKIIKPYNVIYISIEDAMPSFGCYGDTIAITPHVDSFAKDALLFEDVHCQVALCTPSRTSILTGLRPSTTGIVKIDDNWQEVLSNTTSLPRHFRNNGYFTSLAGKIHDTRCGGMDAAYEIIFDEHGLKSNDLALEALNKVSSQKKPFFLAIGYANAHDPWIPTDKAREMYSLNSFTVEGKTAQYKDSIYSKRGIQELERNYYGEITDVDYLIGNFLQKVKELELYENSIILIGAMDHGYNFGYRGHWGKGNNFDNETRVPLLVRVPNNPNNGKTTDAMVELVDLYPSLIDLCNLPMPSQNLEGSSFVPLLENPTRKWKEAVFTHRAYAEDIVAVKTSNYNLIDYAGDSVQLFDRVKDPINLTDLSKDLPEKVDELMAIQKRGWQAAKPNP